MILTNRSLVKALNEVLYQGGQGREKIEELNKEILILKNEVTDLKLKKRIEEEEIKHLVKMKEEKMNLDLQKKEVELQKGFQKLQMDLQSSYHDKVLVTIEESRKESKELYTKIMERLPNVNVEMKR